jgi:hypothetical protein
MLKQYDQWTRKHGSLQRRYERIFKAEDEDETNNDDEDTNNDSNDERHLVDQLADLIVEAGSTDGKISRQDALRWLLHTRRGQALVTRMGKNNERTADMTFPIHKVAKSIAETGTSWLTEQQLTEKIFEHAQRDRHSGETPEQAFARHFNAGDEQGLCAQEGRASCAGWHLPSVPALTRNAACRAGPAGLL